MKPVHAILLAALVWLAPCQRRDSLGERDRGGEFYPRMPHGRTCGHVGGDSGGACWSPAPAKARHRCSSGVPNPQPHVNQSVSRCGP